MRTTFWGTSAPAATSHLPSSCVGEVQLVVEPLAHSQWRVCDGRWAEHDPQHLLGFIELTEDSEFEVMSLARGFEWFTYPTFDEASAHFICVMHDAAPVSADSHVVFSAATTRLLE